MRPVSARVPFFSSARVPAPIMPDGYDGGAKTTTQETTDGNGNLTNQQTDTTTCTGHKCPK